ncbi:hypothetical protein NUSPORA_00586 [Nucleospora cyclopteri]
MFLLKKRIKKFFLFNSNKEKINKTSSTVQDVKEEFFCRICYGTEEPGNNLVSPCNCKGSVKYIHIKCLRYWRIHGRNVNEMNNCEQCKTGYKVEGDQIPTTIITHGLTVSAILLLYLFAFNIFTILYQSYSVIFEDIMMQPMNLSKYLYHSSFVMAALTVYSLFSNAPLFGIFNYLFTFWRILHFNFLIDNTIFVGMSIYYFKSMYKKVNRYVNYFCFYILNRDYYY